MNGINRIETAGNKTSSRTSSYPVKDFLLLLVGLRRSFASLAENVSVLSDDEVKS